MFLSSCTGLVAGRGNGFGFGILLILAKPMVCVTLWPPGTAWEVICQPERRSLVVGPARTSFGLRPYFGPLHVALDAISQVLQVPEARLKLILTSGRQPVDTPGATCELELEARGHEVGAFEAM
ncbi:MAG TPA: hypothetical protein VJ739_16080 [Gemmataceae bacterium]|nr:hypothetical protein [Gemmataceae bacterium]